MKKVYFKYILISALVAFSVLMILVILNGMFGIYLPNDIPIVIVILSQSFTTYYLFNKENRHKD